ncbi:MAG: hypothetical protein J0H29_09005 [Sphingobacteriales bacterium]|nr:hypothetical protein [Sphingobacteriales bacterium]
MKARKLSMLLSLRSQPKVGRSSLREALVQKPGRFLSRPSVGIELLQQADDFVTLMIIYIYKQSILSLKSNGYSMFCRHACLTNLKSARSSWHNPNL